MMPMVLACRVCSSRDVVRDAWAAWDITAQAWTLAAVFDAAFCNRCGNEVSLDEVPVDGAPRD